MIVYPARRALVVVSRIETDAAQMRRQSGVVSSALELAAQEAFNMAWYRGDSAGAVRRLDDMIALFERDEMSDTTTPAVLNAFLTEFGDNASFALDLYAQYRLEPASVFKS